MAMMLSRRRMFGVFAGIVSIGALPKADHNEWDERTFTDSKSIVRARYSKRSAALEIEFRSGMVYRYRQVPERIFTELVGAESKGRYFAKSIRGKYAYQRVTPVAP